MPGELISREALERTIPRPAERQAAERDIGEGVSKEELLALGQDRDRRIATAGFKQPILLPSGGVAHVVASA